MSTVKMELDTRAFTETLKAYAKVSKKDEEEIVLDRGGKVSFELYKKFKAAAPKVSLLKSLPERLNYRVKRKAGVTVAQEIKRRIAARFSAAAGWLPAVRKLTKRGSQLIKKKGRGTVSINLSEPSVTITNNMLQAFKAEERHHIMQEAIDAQTADMMVYIKRKLEQRAGEFSK